MFDVERRDGVAIVRLNNPPVNAVGFDRWRLLPPLVAEIDRDASIGAIVFTGLPGRHFCGGNDVREFASLSPEETLAGTAAVRDAMRAVRESARPAVAALHGAAMGSGLMLSCACDIRIATPDARLALPEVKVGAFGGYRIVREMLGQGEARLLAYSGRPLSGERAYALGLVQDLAPTAEDALARAVALATEISGLLRGRLRAEIKATLNAEDAQPLWQAYDLERSLAARTMGSADA